MSATAALSAIPAAEALLVRQANAAADALDRVGVGALPEAMGRLQASAQAAVCRIQGAAAFVGDLCSAVLAEIEGLTGGLAAALAPPPVALPTAAPEPLPAPPRPWTGREREALVPAPAAPSREDSGFSDLTPADLAEREAAAHRDHDLRVPGCPACDRLAAGEARWLEEQAARGPDEPPEPPAPPPVVPHDADRLDGDSLPRGDKDEPYLNSYDQAPPAPPKKRRRR